jgi:ABC-type amino acid transport substrate-binding protein
VCFDSGSEVVSLDALIAQRVAAGEKVLSKIESSSHRQTYIDECSLQVRQLKESKADAALVSAAVAELQALKEQVDKLVRRVSLYYNCGFVGVESICSFGTDHRAKVFRG